MKFRILSAVWIILLAGLLISDSVLAQCGSKCKSDKKEKVKQEAIQESEANQTTCPVMGGKIKKDIYTDHNGKRIYFCCQPCVEKFEKNPEKYLNKLEEEGVILENAPELEKS